MDPVSLLCEIRKSISLLTQNVAIPATPPAKRAGARQGRMGFVGGGGAGPNESFVEGDVRSSIMPSPLFLLHQLSLTCRLAKSVGRGETEQSCCCVTNATKVCEPTLLKL
jgi:hypothetical protein